MNCHMPRLNEGMEHVVRTHMIYSPTEPKMIEAGQPNACNLCHVDRPLEWTLGFLAQWYGASFSEALTRKQRQRRVPMGLAWLRHAEPSVRLAGAAALLRAEANWALADLLGVLDDPALINRQFAQEGLQDWLGIRLVDFGYRFYQMAEERAKSLARLRAALQFGWSER